MSVEQPFLPGTVSAPPTPLPTTPGGWGTIVADPPWMYRDRGSRSAPGYSLMSEAEISLLPVRHIRAEQAHLYLWVTDSFLRLGLQTMETWGFEYKQTLVWVKRHDWNALPAMGMGHWYRHCHELILFGVAGGLPAARHDLRSVFDAPRGRHSEKPAALQELAEKMSPGPYLELFARRQRPGWEVWGNEVPKQEACHTPSPGVTPPT